MLYSKVGNHSVSHFIGYLGRGVIIKVYKSLEPFTLCLRNDLIKLTCLHLLIAFTAAFSGARFNLSHITEKCLVNRESGDNIVVVYVCEFIDVPFLPGPRAYRCPTTHVTFDSSFYNIGGYPCPERHAPPKSADFN